MKNSKFIPLYETITARYKQGAGFLEGDIVKLKSDYKSLDAFKELNETVKARIEDAEKTGYNLRVARLHTPNNQYGSYGYIRLPATHADIYQEKAPGYFSNITTVPLSIIEAIDTGVNLAPISKNNRRDNGENQKPQKWKSNKDTPETKEQNHLGHDENWVKNGNYELAEKNKKPGVGANDYDDTKPSTGYKPLSKNKLKPKTLKESEQALDSLYIHILREDDNDMERVKESNLRMPDGTVVDTQKLQSLFAKVDRNMNDNDFYGDIDDANVYDALRRGDVEGAADEICYSYTGRDGGEVDTEGIFKDIVSNLNYIIRNSKPTGTHPEVGVGEAEMEETENNKEEHDVYAFEKMALAGAKPGMSEKEVLSLAFTNIENWAMATRKVDARKAETIAGNILYYTNDGDGASEVVTYYDHMFPKTATIAEEICPICKRDVCQCNEMEMMGNDMEAPCPKCHTNPCTCLEEVYDESDLKHHVKDECWNMEENRLVDECWGEDGSVKEECWASSSNAEPAPAQQLTGQEAGTREDGPMEESEQVKRAYLPGGHPKDGVTIKAHPNSYLS